MAQSVRNIKAETNSKKLRYQTDPVYRDKVCARNRAYYKRDEEFRRHRINEAVRWNKKNPERAHATVLKSKRKGYPIPTREVSDSCEICGLRSDKALCLDHCHLTHTFRGWLCSPCNIGLGNFRDNIQVLEAAVAYLRRHSA